MLWSWQKECYGVRVECYGIESFLIYDGFELSSPPRTKCQGGELLLVKYIYG